MAAGQETTCSRGDTLNPPGAAHASPDCLTPRRPPGPGRSRTAEVLRRPRRGRDEGVRSAGRDHCDCRERQGHPRARLWHQEPRNGGCGRRRHAVPDRVDDQGVHVGRARDPGRGRQDRLGRPGDRPPARVPDVRSLGHARDHDPRPARAPQRPRPRAGRPDVRAVHRDQPSGPGAADPVPQAENQFSLGVRL